MADIDNVAGTKPFEVTTELFRSAMASFAAGVTVVTTLDAAERPCALTATAFTSVSMKPPRCLVCIHRHARPHRALLDSARFAVNILSAEQEELSARFAAPLADRFAGVRWKSGAVTSCPILEGALAWMECDVAEIYSSGDHDIVVGDLRSIQARDGAPLVYFRGSCQSLPPLPVKAALVRAERSDVAHSKAIESQKAHQGSAESPQEGSHVKPRNTQRLANQRSLNQRYHGIPEEFHQYLVDQQYDSYLTEHHDVWRSVLDRNQELVSQHEQRVHPAYVAGMKQLDLPSHIPRIEEINERLRATGWKTVCVDGYVPSAAYAGLMCRRIFPISRQIRRKEHVDFAPAPDMVHDILGHLAMLYLPQHRAFLQRISAVMAKARSNQLDSDFYASSVHMANLKWDPASPPNEVALAAEKVASIHRALADNASEVTQMRRMYIWSVEFGLMGTTEDFYLFGAAFFASPTEFLAACNRRVPILPYSLNVIHYENAFSDLLEQYFVADDFDELESVLEQYEARLLPLSEAPRTSEIRGILPNAQQRGSGNA